MIGYEWPTKKMPNKGADPGAAAAEFMDDYVEGDSGLLSHEQSMLHGRLCPKSIELCAVGMLFLSCLFLVCITAFNCFQLN